jgi:hypothetical protein
VIAGHYAWFKALAIGILSIGISIHVLRLVLGTDWLLRAYVTPDFDMVLAIGLSVVAACLWALRGQVEADRRADRLRYRAVTAYFTISVPLHLATYGTRSTELLRVFPEWSSFVVIWVQLAFIVSLWRTRLRLEPAGLPALVLRLDGLFLLVAGGAALLLELLAHFFDLGPQRPVFGGHAWPTLGFVEAHGLAVVLGVVLLRAATAPSPAAHLLATTVHVLLGGANLLFWGDTVVPLGQQTVVAAATGVHLVIAEIQGSYALGPLRAGTVARLLFPRPPAHEQPQQIREPLARAINH